MCYGPAMRRIVAGFVLFCACASDAPAFSPAPSGPAKEPASTEPAPPSTSSSGGMNAMPADAGTTTAPTSTSTLSDASAPPTSLATDVPPASSPFFITVAGQTAWVHDEHSPAGYFNTYDSLDVGRGDRHKVFVFLPRSYGAGTRDLPVLVMNDGDTTFFNGGPAHKTWDMQRVLSELYAAHRTREFAIVAIVPIEREREYTHTAWAPGHACCGLDAYVSYVADGVLPWIMAQYRFSPRAADHVIAGSSHGGLASFRMATVRPDAFRHALAMSPSFWVGLDLGYFGGALRNAALVTSVATTLGDITTRPSFWIDWGLVRDGGLQNSVIEAMAASRGSEMADLLRSDFHYASSELQTQEDPMGAHDESSWSRRIATPLASLFAP